MNELSGTLASKNIPFQKNPISVERFGSLIDLVQDGTITGTKNHFFFFLFSFYLIVSIGKTGKDVIKFMIDNTLDPLDIVKEKGWLRITDKVQLKSLCDELINKNSQKVSENSITRFFFLLH